MSKILFIAMLFVLFCIPFFSLHEAKAAVFKLTDQKSCNDLGGSWDSSFVCVIRNLTIKSGDLLTITGGTTLSITGDFLNSGNITNSGTIGNNPGGNITDYGNITNSGLIMNMGFVNVLDSGFITNNAASTIINGYLINNYGNITNEFGGTFTSSEIVNNFGSLSNSGTVINLASSPIYNAGIITNTDGITNSGFVNNTGSITDTCNGIVNNINNGTVSGNPIQIKCGVPQPPKDLIASAISSSQINLSWNTPDNGGSTITGYMIDRSTDGGTTWSTIKSNTGNTTTVYSDIGLSTNKTYAYRVSAINGKGTSSPSNAASATTLPAVSQPPKGLTATVISSSQINLSWTAPNIGGSTITGYMIDRSTDGGTTWSTIKSNTGSTATSYSNTGLAANKTYAYRVSVINDIGTSSPSNTASATTLIVTNLSLNKISNVKWGETIKASGRLVDSNVVGVANKNIFFDGTGAINLPSTVTNATGYYSSSGASPSLVSNGWTIQAHFAGDSKYAAKDSPKINYDTSKRATKLTLSLPASLIHGNTYSITGILIDSLTGKPISSQTITFTATSPITIPSAITNSTGYYTVNNLVAPAKGSYNIQAKYAGNSLYASNSITKTLKVT